MEKAESRRESSASSTIEPENARCTEGTLIGASDCN